MRICNTMYGRAGRRERRLPKTKPYEQPAVYMERMPSESDIISAAADARTAVQQAYDRMGPLSESTATPVRFLIELAYTHGLWMKEMGFIAPSEFALLSKALQSHLDYVAKNGEPDYKTELLDEISHTETAMAIAPTMEDDDDDDGYKTEPFDFGAGLFRAISRARKFDASLWNNMATKDYLKHVIDYVTVKNPAKLLGGVCLIVASAMDVPLPFVADLALLVAGNANPLISQTLRRFARQRVADEAIGQAVFVQVRQAFMPLFTNRAMTTAERGAAFRRTSEYSKGLKTINTSFGFVTDALSGWSTGALATTGSLLAIALLLVKDYYSSYLPSKAKDYIAYAKKELGNLGTKTGDTTRLGISTEWANKFQPGSFSDEDTAYAGGLNGDIQRASSEKDAMAGAALFSEIIERIQPISTKLDSEFGWKDELVDELIKCQDNIKELNDKYTYDLTFSNPDAPDAERIARGRYLEQADNQKTEAVQLIERQSDAVGIHLSDRIKQFNLLSKLLLTLAAKAPSYPLPELRRKVDEVRKQIGILRRRQNAGGGVVDVGAAHDTMDLPIAMPRCTNSMVDDVIAQFKLRNGL